MVLEYEDENPNVHGNLDFKLTYNSTADVPILQHVAFILFYRFNNGYIYERTL